MRWTVEPTALDWVHDRLDDFVTGRVGSLVPSGFEAYARVLPPIRDGERRPGGVHEGAPEADVARALVDILRAGMAPDAERTCWFAVWDGYAWVWDHRPVTSTARPPDDARPTADGFTVPAHVRDGPRAWRPHRAYVLYTGVVDDALATAGSGMVWTYGEAPDLWWPADRSWFVGADTDLTCTYLGASRATVDQLLADERVEARTVTRDDPLI